MCTKRGWSDEQIDILKKYYPIGGGELCREKGIAKSVSAIDSKAMKLFLPSFRSKKREWLDEEIAILKQYYVQGGYGLCQEKGLKRTKVAILEKVKEIGLSIDGKSDGWSKEDLGLLREYYPKGGYGVCKKNGLNKPKEVVVSKAKSMGLTFLEGVSVLWCANEVELLRKYYPKGGYGLCQSKGLNKSSGSINGKASTLGLKYDDSSHISWSEGDTDLLRKYYPEGGSILCKEKGLDRALGSITSKASRLGIATDTNRWSEEELELLRKYYPKGGSILCIANGLNRALSSISSKANREGIVVNSVEWSEEELKLLNEYYPQGGSELCVAKGLNYPQSAIRRRANKEGISARTGGTKWSELEIDLLKKYYPQGSSKLCQANGLNRSYSAITARACIEGLKSELWSIEDLNLLHRYYPKGGYKLCQEKGIAKSQSTLNRKAKNEGITFVSWSIEDLNLLHRYYPQGGYKLCQEKGLNKPRTTINYKAKNEGISKPEGLGDLWTSAMVDILREYYPKGGYKLCQEKGLLKSEKGIIMKANRMGISKLEDVTNLWNSAMVDILREYYPKGGSKLCKEKGLLLSTSAICMKANKMGIVVKR